MKVLSTLTSLTWKQVALGSVAVSTVSFLAASFFKGKNYAACTQFQEENKEANLKEKNIQDCQNSDYASLFFIRIYCAGLISLIGAGLKGTYNWIRS